MRKALAAVSLVLYLLSSLVLLSGLWVLLASSLAAIVTAAVLLRGPRCSNCSRCVDPRRAYRWRGKLFCSKKCRDAYRRRLRKGRRYVLPALSALEKVY